MRAFIPAAVAALAIVATAAPPAGTPAAAYEVKSDGIMVVHPMARPVMAGRPAAGYMAIVNEREQPLRLVDARSPAFEAVELHESVDEDGVSKMRRVEVLEIAPGDTALLEPGGLHLMLIGATEALKVGEQFPLTLILEGGETLDVPVMVDPMAGAAGGAKDPDREGMDHGAMDHGGMEKAGKQ